MIIKSQHICIRHIEQLKFVKSALVQTDFKKANDYLHLIEVLCGIHKPLTMHVARHSFATLALSYDIPIEDVARMMGHKFCTEICE